MNQEEAYKKTDEVLAKFKNGKELFRTSVLFNKTVQMLVRDTDPYEMIEALIKINENTQQSFEQHLMRDHRQLMVPPKNNTDL